MKKTSFVPVVFFTLLLTLTFMNIVIMCRPSSHHSFQVIRVSSPSTIVSLSRRLLNVFRDSKVSYLHFHRMGRTESSMLDETFC